MNEMNVLFKIPFERKKKALVAILCSVSLFVLSCGRTEIEKPSDVMPICWEDYNDVYHVFWNYRSRKCSTKTGTTGKTIKVFGWVKNVNTHELLLVSDPNVPVFSSYDNSIDVYSMYIRKGIAVLQVRLHPIADEAKIKLDTCDFTKKCFIQGELAVENRHSKPHCSIVPTIVLNDIDDIYFESDKNVDE